jgi:hypothetical protein
MGNNTHLTIFQFSCGVWGDGDVKFFYVQYYSTKKKYVSIVGFKMVKFY